MDSVALLAAAVSMTPAYRLNLPSLAEVATGGYLPMASVVKPMSAEDLYEWCVRNGQPDVNSSWASAWPAAAALANLLAREPDLVRGRSVVELGAGLGVAGLSAAQAGASSVTLVDREPLALHCAMSTAECCELQGEDESTPLVKAVAADWAAVAEGLRDRCTECLYDPSDVGSLVECVARLLGGNGTLVLNDPAKGRAVGCRAAAQTALLAAGATDVSEEPLPAPIGVGVVSEPLVLLRAEFRS